MLCPNCGGTCQESARFCPSCGVRLTPAQAAETSEPAVSPVSTPEPVPAPETTPKKKGTHWIPIAIMGLLCVIGLGLFFFIPYGEAPAQIPVASDSETPWFQNVDGTLYFWDELYTGSAEVTVPETVDGLPVERLGAYCFADCTRIETVILPDTLVAIENSAFSGCTAMRGIFIPEGVTYIGSDAFYNCDALEAICIPASMAHIESGAFDGCDRLDYILYDGIHSHWNDLYSDYIGHETQVYCTDGTFIQRQRFP